MSNKQIKETFGQRLARFRNKAGYSQRDFAQEAGITQRMVANYESQGGNPPIDVLPKLAKTLGITIDELIGFNLNSDTYKYEIKNQKLVKKIKQIEELPAKDKNTIIKVIDQFMK